MLPRKTAGRILFSLCIASSFLFLPAPWARASEDPFAALRLRLVKDGASPMHVHLVYQPGVVPYYKTVAGTLRIRESRLDYAQFLAPRVQADARRFIRLHRPAFARAQELYGVDPFTIAAILSVETRLGQYTGSTSTLAVLSTFALMDDKAQRDRIWKLLSPREHARWGREKFDAKLLQRSDWAYKELLAFLSWTEGSHHAARSLEGSVMGATGWPQFLPSSLVRYGIDGNGDGRVDLFHPADAILSTANYLKGYGWRPDATREEKKAVIYEYNHSGPYVDTIMELARRLRAGS